MKLTKAEQHLLEYPPNHGTWQCNATHKLKSMVPGEDEEYVCQSVQTAKHKTCVICQTPKSRRATNLHALYLTVCDKAGVQPKGVAA